MKKFTTDFGRGIRSVVKSRPRPRSAKLRQLRQTIHEDQQSPLQSPLSDRTDASPRTDAFTTLSESDEPELRNEPVVSTSGLEAVIEVPEHTVSDHEVPSQGPSPWLPVGTLHDEPVILDWDESTPVEAISERPERNSTDPQALRSLQYITFNGEDETDYTEGLVRIVDASDGVKECAALLLNLNISKSIQRAILAQRDFVREKRLFYEHLEKSMRFEGEIRVEISSHDARLHQLEAEEAAKDQYAALEEEKEILETMFERSQADTQIKRQVMESKATMLREIQAESNAYLEDAFVYALLLEPASTEPDPAIEDKDLRKEYQKLRAQLHQEQGIQDGTIVPLDTSRKHLEAPSLSLEEQTKRDLMTAYWASHERLQDSRFAFDRRLDDRALERAANEAAVNQGDQPYDASPLDFDYRWYIRIQALTRALIDAEAEVAQAKAVALAGGVQVGGEEQASGFLDSSEDGYRMSFEDEMVRTAPVAEVLSWLEEIPEGASPAFYVVPDFDDWGGRALGLSDSISILDQGDVRRRIDKWESMRGLQRMVQDRDIFAGE